MERPVGETFTTKEGVKLEVVKCISCKGCFYDSDKICEGNLDITGECAKEYRLRFDSVIFKEVTDETNNH